MTALDCLGGDTWFRLGDKDLATHLRRTELLAQGWPPSKVTAELGRRLGIQATVLPMSDQPVETCIQLAESGEWVHFQEYFVHRRTDVAIRDVRFEGIEQALPAPGVLDAIASAQLVAICPSNPFVSIAPILAVPGVREAIDASPARVVGVSPIIGGATVKGPAARMLAELGLEVSVLGVARQYAGLVDMFVIDAVDAHLADGLRALEMKPVVTDAWMRNKRGEARFARAVLRAVER